ncbi:hypothetical protein CAPTEDRAFT_195118 [Capitella teleta]|uniref:Endonuclease/exonuclease/phosphatase domain-containing protein n=1 Tax=Capitella teleta TaxID=283909 RepID=R7VE88_CAPTE|nr:hypothetical protein CAPTEDRAFT_195118 [Capitella teleta]|eukprot:ELU16887.1 hypothetical protein CAPTEDRAFT_195118 [Capitella teleta]
MDRVLKKEMGHLVNVPTQVSKNTLDHVCIRENDTLSKRISFEEATVPGVISDHILLLFNIVIMRQKRRKIKITYRRWVTLDKQVFAENVTIGLSRIPPSNSCSHQLQSLTDACTDVLDTLGPRKSNQVSKKPAPDGTHMKYTWQELKKESKKETGDALGTPWISHGSGIRLQK